MKRVFIAVAIFVAALVGISTPAAAQGAWKGTAISDAGDVRHDWGDTEPEALQNALRKCRSVRRGNVCQDDVAKSISVEYWWWTVVINCNDRKFVAGSQWNQETAFENAVDKAPSRLRNSCYTEQELAGTTPPIRAQGR